MDDNHRHRVASRGRAFCRILFFDGSGRVLAPLRPTTDVYFDFGITDQFQSECLDRGSSAGSSVAYRSIGRQNSLLAEDVFQLRLGFEPTVFPQ